MTNYSIKTNFSSLSQNPKKENRIEKKNMTEYRRICGDLSRMRIVKELTQRHL